MEDLQFQLGEANGDDRQHVVYLRGDAKYPDCFNADSGYERRESVKRALVALGLKTKNVESLEVQLAELIADAAARSKGDNAVKYPALDVRRAYDDSIRRPFSGQPHLGTRPALDSGRAEKAMKTTLLVALILALATGRPFLETFEVFSAVAVGMMTGESGLPTIQETIRRIARTMGIDPATITNLVVTDKVPQIGDLRHLDAIRDFILEHGLKVLIIDPAYMAMSGADAGNMFIQGQVLRGISELCQELDCTLILCHHTKRHTGRESFEPPELEDIAWAGFQEWARQWLRRRATGGLRTRDRPASPLVDRRGLHRARGAMGH